MRKNEEIKEKFTESKGITLIALVITIIVLLILSAVSIATLTGENGILNEAEKAQEQTNKSSIKEKIEIEYCTLKYSDEAKNKTSKEVFEMLKDKLGYKGTIYEIYSRFMIIETKEGDVYTLWEDGSVFEGKHIYMNIADGAIDFQGNECIQGTVEYNNNLYNLNESISIKYDSVTITGKTEINPVRILSEGNYNIILKDLYIDLSENEKDICAFNANRNGKETGVYVNLTIQGENTLISSKGAALGFAKGLPNINGVTNGSTLTINGDGTLNCQGGFFSAGIGSGYTGYEECAGDANNIIINSGNIITNGGSNGAGIGGALWKNANNIVINGGKIECYGKSYGAGIGATNDVGQIIINGGEVYAYAEHSNAIGGNNIEKIEINGGKVVATKTNIAILKNTASGDFLWNCCIGGNGDIVINDGDISCKALKEDVYGIYANSGEIYINGGKLQIEVVSDDYETNKTPIKKQNV